jgi:hypothetical protein
MMNTSKMTEKNATGNNAPEMIEMDSKNKNLGASLSRDLIARSNLDHYYTSRSRVGPTRAEIELDNSLLNVPSGLSPAGSRTWATSTSVAPAADAGKTDPSQSRTWAALLTQSVSILSGGDWGGHVSTDLEGFNPAWQPSTS